MIGDFGQELDEVLGLGIRSLDITAAENRLLVTRYLSVGQFLSGHWHSDPADWEIYPQGSMRLGTVTRNIHRNDEIDIDLVAERQVDKTQTSQAQLKQDTGVALTGFVGSQPEGNPVLDEPGKRCWTLLYPGSHLDVLPAVPDAEGAPDSILITDTELRMWQHSNPIGYAAWFHGIMNQSLVVKASVSVDEVPAWPNKTVLQQAVQALKRHRDIYFTGRLEDRPASVIITTLAALAFHPGGSLYETLCRITSRMPGLVEFTDAGWCVLNPVNPKENFADRWRNHPARAAAFFEWIEAAQADFAAIGQRRGPEVFEVVSKSLGHRVAAAASAGRGAELLKARTSGRLSVTTGAAVSGLATAGGRVVRPHNFHGSSPH